MDLKNQVERFGDSGRRKIGVGFGGDKDNNNSNDNNNNSNIDSNVTRVDPGTQAIGTCICILIVKSNFHLDIQFDIEMKPMNSIQSIFNLFLSKLISKYLDIDGSIELFDTRSTILFR